MSERDDELESTAEERAEAEALARALERGGAGAMGPEDAASAAALLRAAARPELEPARLEAAAARGRAALAARRRPRRLWLLPVLLAPAAAAAALFLVASSQRSAGLASRAPRAPLPVPSAELLEAQARAARGRPDLTALDAEMRDFRAAYYAALAEEAP
jgi:hypothetical protein